MWDSCIFCAFIPQVSLLTTHTRHECIACVLREIRAGGCLEAGMTSVTRMIAKSFESHLLSSVHEIIL